MNHLKHDLVVIRISDSAAMSELNKKTIETADMHSGIPGAEMLRKLAGSPLRDPDSVNGRAIAAPGFKAVYFRLPGTNTHVLMALGSATMANLGEDDNAFVTLLADLLKETPVESIWVADFSRLLRSVDYFSHTWRAIRDHCRYVRHAGAVIDTSSAAAEIQFLFEALSSAAEARFVVQRTTRGKMRAYVDGRCPLSSDSVPTGWIRDEHTRLHLDQDQPMHAVRTIVQVLGDPTMNNEDRVIRASDAGARSRPRSRILGRDVRLDELSNPSETVRRWYELLDTWRTGSWVVEYELPALLNQTHFDYDLEIAEDGRGTRIWRMTFNLPMPGGGWATDDEFDAAIRLRDRRAEHATPQGGSAAGSVRKPFCGLPSWKDENYEYKLLSQGKRLYELRRRPVEDATQLETINGRERHVAKGWGRAKRKDGIVIATISAPELHRVVTEGLVEAATRGLSLRTAVDHLLMHDSEGVVDELKAKLTVARLTERNSRRSANEATSDRERQGYTLDARTAATQADHLERDLLAFVGATGSSPLPVDAEAVAVALAAIADEPDHVEGRVADAFRVVMTDFSLTDISDGTASWQASLRVPLVGGVMSIGPAVGQLAIGGAPQLAARRANTLAARACEATRLFMAHGLSIDEVSHELGIATTRRVEQTVRDHLQSKGAPAQAATALVAWTPATGRRVVWARLNGVPYPRDVPLAYAAHVAKAYLEADVRRDNNIQYASRLPRAVVAAVLEHGGWVPNDGLKALAARAEVGLDTLRYYIGGRVRNGGHVPNYLHRVDGGVGLVPCPHDCEGWATRVTMLPEVTRELLCPTCRRMPDSAAVEIVFPEEYLDD
jgi:hypothetical protein